MNTFWFPKTSFSDPDYVPTVYRFETTEELLALKPVKWYDRPGAKFVLSDNHLMILLKDDFEWWVVGCVSNPDAVNLPKWKGPKVWVRFDNGCERVAQDGEVVSICGDEIKLRSGETVTRI
jgi:hypothetical protein